MEAILIPVKRLSESKLRLAGVLGPPQRRRLALSMLADVLLAAAGCNYFMAVPMGDDVMLSYQCTSYHDAAALRAVLGLRPAPEFERWCEDRGILRDGCLTARAGDPALILGDLAR